jgi:FkbM family methyltransferase
VLDVGANIGSFMAYLSREHSAQELEVHCFEPVPQVAEVLNANVALLRKEEGLAQRVTVHAIGLSDRDEDGVVFEFCPMMSFTSSRYPYAQLMARFGKKDVDPSEYVAAILGDCLEIGMGFDKLTAALLGGLKSRNALVRGVVFMIAAGYAAGINSARVGLTKKVRCRLRKSGSVLAELMNGRAIGLLKVDVEGAEPDVFRGLDDAELARVRQIVVEVHGTEATRALEARLLGLGYKVTTEQEEFGILKMANVHNVYAVRAFDDSELKRAAPDTR